MRGDGRDLIMQLALQTIKTHKKKLTGNNKLNFATTIAKSANNFISAYTANKKKRTHLPARLPAALPTQKETLREFHTHEKRKRAITALEMIEDDEKKAKQTKKKRQKKETINTQNTNVLALSNNNNNEVIFVGQSQRKEDSPPPAPAPQPAF